MLAQSPEIIREQFRKHKFSWINSFASGLSQDQNYQEIPWMAYPAIEFLQNNLQPHYRVFEFGCGTSTLFFARICLKTISIESNKMWFKIVAQRLQKLYGGDLEDNYFCNNKAEIFLIENAVENSEYQNFARNFSRTSNKKFDLIIVDSMKRFDCVKYSIEALSSNGTLILDDSERLSYKKIFDFLSEKNFLKQDFFGISPGQLRIKNTSFFSKKIDSLY